MPNPYLPNWEYIPDGEPRVFGNRVYVYGSHDYAGSDQFCDYKLKVWSADVHDLNNWICHGDSFHTRMDRDHASDTPWTDRELYAPDVIKKDGKYYLYAYIVDSKGCVAVSERPEGPFRLVSQYRVPETSEQILKDGIFIDPGVLVDDDGRVYIYCGYLKSYMAEINAENMYEILEDSYKADIIPVDEPFGFFEGCSPRKIGDTYYLIYSPKNGNRLDYATSQSPTGPFQYRGTIIDNGVDYPGGNNHGSICQINGKYYIFYHRTTNNTVMSRRGCVECIEILPDGSIPQVEMTSLGFEASLSPYRPTSADIACVLKGGCYITERNILERGIVNLTKGCIVGFKYFDFGEDYSSKTMEFTAKIRGCGNKGKMRILIDDYHTGKEIGTCEIGPDNEIVHAVVASVTGRHSVYFVFDDEYSGYFGEFFKDRPICELESFVFHK
ncbi:family 43 glycosylhydrolase [Halalkalibacterium halodurans]|uniref:family 43 glycosylhydrolase n=1 Tax=Halalkalibacterium halodurans TaxID=86665 RepID=UPI002AA9B99C|nr:family 43 glycosylhydrolase [Halalkalibacterium halodurans]MDY7221505.1 family 43 glycosylhydrolase [Halalkalibacterium halodurans]MDY7240781.1 family 43 glycosylhydrolase [Halalkalibacterium halodurans]